MICAFALPLTTGPGSIAAAVALGAGRSADAGTCTLLISAISALLVAASVAATIWLAYSKVERIASRFGPQGTVVANKLTAFLLLCIGVQIIMTGVPDAPAPVIRP